MHAMLQLAMPCAKQRMLGKDWWQFHLNGSEVQVSLPRCQLQEGHDSHLLQGVCMRRTRLLEHLIPIAQCLEPLQAKMQVVSGSNAST